MLAIAPPRPVTGDELSLLADATERLMVAVQEEGVTGRDIATWTRLEAGLAEVLDSAIVLVPDVARRWVVAHQRLGWLLRNEARGPEVDDHVVDDLETVLECLLAYDEGLPIAADRTPAQLIEWLVDALDLSQARVAALIGVSLRTLQRWLRGQAKPAADDAAHIRRLARLVNQARFALSPAGVLAWLERPAAYLDGGSPGDLVLSTDADADSQLDRLTATLRYV